MALDSVYPFDWDWERARHLLFRAGFGGHPEEIDDFKKRGLTESLSALFSTPSQPLFVPDWLSEEEDLRSQQMKLLSQPERQKIQTRMGEHLRDLIGEWINLMIASPTPADMLHQKMVFFWHNHFATSTQKVNQPVAIYKQLLLFQDKALARFDDLLHSIIRDPAMLRYLDNDQNRKGKPNENLARELMELFSLGTGSYTEKDIREGARALTGWGLQNFQFGFQGNNHDNDVKTIFGQTGNFDGDDFIDLILGQSQCAEFMTRKVWTYFASDSPSSETIQHIASEFRDSRYEIKTLLRSIFSHPDFYSTDVMGSQIKSPIQLVVGTARTLGLHGTNIEFFRRMLQNMGQVPYMPPNVKGWLGGRNWIDTSRLVARYTFADNVGEGKVPAEIDPRQKGDLTLPAMKVSETQDPHMEKQAAATQAMMKETSKMEAPHALPVHIDVEKLIDPNLSPIALVDKLASILLPLSITETERHQLVDKFNLARSKKSQIEALQQLIAAMMLLPAYQLC